MNTHLRLATILTSLLDTQFKIGKVRFGFDPILGLIPGFGDLLSLFLSGYLVWIAARMHIPDEEIGKMLKNIFYDFILGSIPIIGDIGDIFYKANTKNLIILKKYSGRIVEGEIVDEPT